MNNIKNWLQTRFPFNWDILKVAGSEPVPNHLKHWWWCLGGTPLYLFIVQIFTGILLSFYYVPGYNEAYDSVKNITENISYGWYIRSLHKWSANFMIISVILHMMRVFFTGSYRKPRELNWMMGVLLLTFTLITGFTGYSLIFEQLSYWGITVATNIMGAVPFVGDSIAAFIRGGEKITQLTLSRMFMFHAAILPTTLIFVIIIHITMIRLHGVTEFAFKKSDRKKHFPFYPEHLITEIIIALVIMIGISILAILFPIGLEEKANPLVTPAHIKPEWYFYFAFRLLKLTSLTASVFIMGGGFMILLMWPFIDEYIRKRKPNSELSMILGVFGVILLTGLTLWEAIALFLSH